MALTLMTLNLRMTATMSDAEQLWQRFDGIGFDLDGVIYMGPVPVPGAPETLTELHRHGLPLAYVTNNASRPPSAVAAQLVGFGIDCAADDVVTSAQATAALMGDALPPGAEVLIVGSAALADEVRAVGLTPQTERTGDTVAIVVGFDPKLTWDQLNEGCYAVQAGAAYFACNDDWTRPTDRGVAIGMGAMLLAVGQVVGVAPIMGGKPARPLLDQARARLGATHPLFVGDRLNTDVEGARAAGWSSLFVLSGGNGPADLVAATPQLRPDYLAASVAGLCEAPREAIQDGDVWRCGGAAAWASPNQSAVIDAPLTTQAEKLDAVWAVAKLVWWQRDNGIELDATAALSQCG